MQKIDNKMLLTRFKQDNTVEIGVDEAGRGSFWGPIMAGAVILPEESQWTDLQKTLFTELRDSKKLTPKKKRQIICTNKGTNCQTFRRNCSCS